MTKEFNALFVSQHERGFTREIKTITTDDLPENDLLLSQAKKKMIFSHPF
jgi:hypothetical protein